MPMGVGIMRVIPVESALPAGDKDLTMERISTLLETTIQSILPRAMPVPQSTQNHGAREQETLKKECACTQDFWLTRCSATEEVRRSPSRRLTNTSKKWKIWDASTR